MQFKSLAEFFSMGGYGFYVWLSFGFCAFIFFGLLASSLFEGKKLKQEIKMQIAREERIKRAKGEL